MIRIRPGQYRDVEPAPSTCPACGATLDAVTNMVGERKPQPGDWSVCSYCAAVLRFQDERTVRELEEGEEIPAEVLAVAEFIKKEPLPRSRIGGLSR